MNNVLALVLGLATLVFVVGAVAFRAVWTAPTAAKLGYLPKSWQRWILGEDDSSR